MKKLYLMLLLILIGSGAIHGQKRSKIEKILHSKQKWSVIQVKSKRPYFEVGEYFTIRIDGKFYHDRNNYAKQGGDYVLHGKTLILTYDSFTEERRRIPFEYTIKKWGKYGFQLSYRNKFNKKEKVYLK